MVSGPGSVTRRFGKFVTLSGPHRLRLGDTRLVTEPEPTSVFRRFPWVQLVFCLACVSMACWTWMRYSYCWIVTADDLALGDFPRAFEERDWPYGGRYVLFSGEITSVSNPGSSPAPQLVREGSMRLKVGEWMGFRVAGTQAFPEVPRCEVPGRLALGHFRYYRGDELDSFTIPSIDATSGRLTGASVSGLVVGAMGCFIFGLYLRTWLGERKALARQPEQDMIA